MAYGIQTDTNRRIVAYSTDGQIFDPERDFMIDTLPEGITEDNIFDYRYFDGEWIYDPAPPSNVEPEETIESLKEKVQALQETNDMLLECVLEMSEIIYA